jgi:RNA polymerase sigma factor (sigma-70 family)
VNDVNSGDLVVAAVAGDRQAFEILVQRHAAVATGVAFSVCGDFSQSEDIGQEAFLEAWKNLATLHEPEKFPAWLCTIVRRRAIDFIRLNRVSRPAYSIETLPAELSDPSQQPPETRMAAQQHQELVWSLLRNLPEDYREPMILFYRCEQSTRDVAVALGVTESTIRQRLNRAREMIRGDVTETIRRTLLETAPKAVFFGIVIASLPSSASAAGVTVTSSAMIGKSVGKVTAAVAPAVGGAVAGSLFGIMGGVFGTWMSWKSCDYESQQKVIRQNGPTSGSGKVGPACRAGLRGLPRPVRRGPHQIVPKSASNPDRTDAWRVLPCELGSALPNVHSGIVSETWTAILRRLIEMPVSRQPRRLTSRLRLLRAVRGIHSD